MGSPAVSRFLYRANIANKRRKSSESLAKGGARAKHLQIADGIASTIRKLSAYHFELRKVRMEWRCSARFRRRSALASRQPRGLHGSPPCPHRECWSRSRTEPWPPQQ